MEKESFNSFDVRLAYQFLRYKDDLDKNEEMRECYRHTNRVLNSQYSSGIAKQLIKYFIVHAERGKYKENLATVCRHIITKSKSEICGMFGDELSEEILKYSDG